MSGSPLTAQRASSFKTVVRDLRPLAAGVQVWKGGLAVANASGFFQEATGAQGEIVVGKFSQSVLNGGGNGAVSAEVYFGGIGGGRERSLILVDNDTVNPVTVAARERMCTVLDDHTATAYQTEGSDLGIVYDVTTEGVWIEMSEASSAQRQSGGSVAVGQPFKIRAVLPSNLAAYTGSGGTGVLTASANGALPAADGVTIKVGDQVALHVGVILLTALKDVGVYQVLSLGGTGAPWQLARVSWYSSGDAIPNGKPMVVTEGTLFGGTTWKSFAIDGKIADTDDGIFFPEEVTQQIQLTTGGGNLAVTNVPLRSTTRSNAVASYAGSGTPNAATLGYQPGAITPAVLGVASSVTIQAVKAAMVAQATDTSVLNLTLSNR